MAEQTETAVSERTMKRVLGAFKNDHAASAFIPFALMLPVLVTITLSGVDYAWAVLQKQAIQKAADTAAIAGGKELSLSDSRRQNVEAVVEAMVKASIARNTHSLVQRTQLPPVVDAVIRDNPLQVEVKVVQQVHTQIGGVLGIDFPPITVKSVARVVGKPNICVLALDPAANAAISLEHDAFVTGHDCAVYSNSSHANAIVAKNSAVLQASFICSRGGKDGGAGQFDPEPLTDCPGFDDPLAGRPEPPVGSCTQNGLVVQGVVGAFAPGTYCGGLTFKAGTNVVLAPGIYVIKDGPLIVEDGASLSGVDVGFFFTGTNAFFRFDHDSKISLAAPVTGAMAGLLMFESRSNPTTAKHEFLSNFAPLVLGTLYLSRGELHIDADNPIAQDSAYTAIVARVMRLYGGPHLILNTNYSQTDVPVPAGIKGAGQPVALVD